MEHLEAMDYLRSSVNLRAYGQREPIVEYKKEGLMMFKEMENTFKDQVFSLVSSINVESAELKHMEAGGSNEPKETLIENHQEPNEFAEKDVGRNDLCPCGSGKKYKKCHGK